MKLCVKNKIITNCVNNGVNRNTKNGQANKKEYKTGILM